MAGMDAQPRNNILLSATTGSTDPADRLAGLTRWVNARIEELHQTEARLMTRLEHLQRSEESLKKLCDTLRQQVAQCQPVLQELSTAQPHVQKLARELAEQARLQLEEILRGQEQRLAHMADQAEQKLESQVRQIDHDLNATCQTVGQYIQHASANAQSLADDLLSSIRRASVDFERLSGQVSLQISDRINAAVARVEQELHQQLAPLQERVEKLIENQRQDVDAALSAAELEMKRRVKTLDDLLADACNQLERRLGDATEELRRLSSQAQVGLMQSIREQIDTMEHETRLAVRPILLKIEEHRDAADAQVRAALDSAEEVLRRRVAELRRNGEATVEAVEQQLVLRLRRLKPQAQTALESVEKILADRVERAIESARSSLQNGEEELAIRIEQLRPKASTFMLVTEKQLRDHLSKLEEEATAMIGWLERRLSQRLDELVDRSRKTLMEEIRRIDQARDQLRHSVPRPCVDAPAVSVEVALPVHGESPQTQAA